MFRLKGDWGIGAWVEDEYGRGECRMEKEKNGKMHIIFVKIIIVCLNVDYIEGRYGGGGWGWERVVNLDDTSSGEGDKVK